MQLRSRRLLILTALIGACGLLAVPKVIATVQAYSEIFRATFDDLPEGFVGDSEFPIGVGTLAAFTGGLEPLASLAPASGIYSGQLILSNVGGTVGSPFGVVGCFAKTAAQGVTLSFTLRHTGPDLPELYAEVTDTTGMDLTRMTLAEDGSVGIGGNEVIQAANTATVVNWFVEISLDGRTDTCSMAITNLDSGELHGAWSGPIEGGYRPAKFFVFRHSGSLGGVKIDNISALEQ
jgi:hypothetical protein